MIYIPYPVPLYQQEGVHTDLYNLLLQYDISEKWLRFHSIRTFWPPFFSVSEQPLFFLSNMSSRSVDRSSTLGTASVRAVERKLPKLTEEQILEFKEAFKLFDKDNGGSIDVDELKDALESLGQVVTEESVQELVDEVDEDGSGEIEFDEFLVLMSRQILNSDVVSFKRTLIALSGSFPLPQLKMNFFLVFFSSLPYYPGVRLRKSVCHLGH